MWQSVTQWRRPQDPPSAPKGLAEFRQHVSVLWVIVLGKSPQGLLAVLGELWLPSALSALEKLQSPSSAPRGLENFRQHFPLPQEIVLGGSPQRFLAVMGALWPSLALSTLK